MKFTTLKVLAVLAVAGAGYAVYSGAIGSSASPNPSIVKAPNHTISGNLLADLDAKEEYVAGNKTITRYETKGREVWLNTQVTPDSAKAVVNELKALEKESNKPIFLLLDSPGGSVYDGNLVASQIEASKAPVYTVCMRLCASMAAYIHSFGHKRMSVDRSILMYHPASGGLRGQVPNMMSMGYSITRTISKLNANIVNRSKISREEFERKVAYEIWIDAEDSLAQGLTDEIVSINSEAPKKQEEQLEQLEEGKVVRPTAESKFYFNLISPYAKELW